MFELTCDECYAQRQPSTEKCPHCGKNWIGQVVGISMHWECQECGWSCISAGGFPTACHCDDKKYKVVIEKVEDKGKLVKLAKLLNVNIPDLNKQFGAGSVVKKCQVNESIDLYNSVCELGIPCELDNRIEEIYCRIMKCPYA